MKTALLAALCVIAVLYILYWILKLLGRSLRETVPGPTQLVIGFITDFLDTLGVGSFAVTTSLYRAVGLVPKADCQVDDAELPGTLNVGHTLPTILQALIYIKAIEIDTTTLVSLIAASVFGAVFGASFVVKMPKARVQFGVGVALAVATVLVLLKLTGCLPGGGEATSLSGVPLVIALVGNFIFGALMTIGVGAYAPIMIMVSLLGMSQKSAFPIMMGACAFLMPLSSWRFIASGKVNTRAALGLAVGGLPGVVIAAFIVQEMDVKFLLWMVVFIAAYTSISLLLAANRGSESASESQVASGREPPRLRGNEGSQTDR